jgi:hypothetical protein
MITPEVPWRRFRILRRLTIFGMIWFFLFGALVLLGRIYERSRTAEMILGFGWAIFVLAMITLTHEVKCPRCGKRFYVKGYEFAQMATECLHCGQPKYADVGRLLEPHSDGESAR